MVLQSGIEIPHELGGVKERTEDVVTGESRKKTFPDLLLSQPVLRGLHTAGFVQPSPVQLLAIPPAKVGFDLIVQSKSGTGKTCVYVVAALEMLKPDLQGLQALVLAPTREIAIQGVTVAMQVGTAIKCEPCTFLSSSPGRTGVGPGEDGCIHRRYKPGGGQGEGQDMPAGCWDSWQA